MYLTPGSHCDIKVRYMYVYIGIVTRYVQVIFIFLYIYRIALNFASEFLVGVAHLHRIRLRRQ
jgi:hypothetical protein